MLVKSQKSKVKSNVLLVAYCLLLIVSFSYFWHNYFNHYTKGYSAEWQYGYKESVALMQKLEKRYDSVVISEAYGRSYMYTLFFTLMDPTVYRASKQSTFDAAGFYHVFGFGKYRFTDKGIGSLEPNTLYVALPREAIIGAAVIATIRRPDGEPAFIVFERPRAREDQE